MDKATLPESSQTQSPAHALYTKREDDRERGVLRVFKLLTANPPSSTCKVSKVGGGSPLFGCVSQAGFGPKAATQSLAPQYKKVFLCMGNE